MEHVKWTTGRTEPKPTDRVAPDTLDPSPDPSRGAVQMLGIVLALVAVAAFAMILGIVSTVLEVMSWL